MTRAAAIDCGTNSIRLLIADIDDGVIRDRERLMRIVRLGQGVDRTGRLDDRALERTFAAASEYAELCSEHQVDAVRFVATSATRDAENRDEFVAGIYARLGVEPEVVSGEEEARLSFTGALSVLPGSPDEASLVVDIGGGSSELVLGFETPVSQYSMNIGCVRMSERHLAGIAATEAASQTPEQVHRTDPPSAAQIAAATRDIEAALDDAERVVDLGATARLIGLAGSVTTVTAHALSLPSYDSLAIDGTYLSTERIHASCQAFIQATRAEREAMGFLHPGRVDVIAAGALVWDRIVARVAQRVAEQGGQLSGATTSEHDILDGIALSVG